MALASAPAFGEGPELRPPLDCGLGTQQQCLIQNYVDADPGPGVSDYACGAQSYDGHKGTDFRVPTLEDMRAGVPVLAAATGHVIATRDGMPDIYHDDPAAPDLDGRECGNGVVIDHGSGWQTQYCHLQKGSVSVQKGDTLEAGSQIGLVGLSGLTEFPHVHFAVRKDGETIDPYNPDKVSTCNGSDPDLWVDVQAVPYAGGGILDVGFHAAIPEFDDIRDGGISPDKLAPDAPALVLWAYLYASQTGDEVKFNIDGPQGWSFESQVRLEKGQAELFRASGKRKPPDGWPEGQYEGVVRFIRNGETKTLRKVSLTIGR